jgi:hypothetical protein
MAAAIDHNTFAAGAPLTPMGQAQGLVEIYTFWGRALYDEWAASWGLTGSNADPMADADGDGQKNILELHSGTDPGDGSSTGTVGLRVSGSYLIVTFPRACPCENTGILTGEVSSDLQSWTTATPAMILVDNASTLQLQIPIVPGQKKFVRFRADLP